VERPASGGASNAGVGASVSRYLTHAHKMGKAHVQEYRAKHGTQKGDAPTIRGQPPLP